MTRTKIATIMGASLMLFGLAIGHGRPILALSSGAVALICLSILDA